MRRLYLPICVVYAAAIYFTTIASMSYQDVRFVEQNDARLVMTSNNNYAITSPKLQPKGWKAVSVNGENILMLTIGGGVATSFRSGLSSSDIVLIEAIRDEISISNTGYTHTSSGAGGNFMMSASQSAGSSFSSSSGQTFSQSSQSSGFGEMSVNMKDENNFSVSKSDLPFNWSQVFFNGEFVTVVFKNGEVKMKTTSVMPAPEVEAVEKLRSDVKSMQRSQTQAVSNTMQHSVDMVSDVFSNIMNRFPKPPSYSSAVGNMFGDNFPFGPNNSPFSSSSGWPFSGGAFAFAGRR